MGDWGGGAGLVKIGMLLGRRGKVWMGKRLYR